MPKPVYLLTVQEAQKEYNSMADQIRAINEQLDSGKFGAVGTPALNADWTCHHQRNSTGPSSTSIEEHLSGLNLYTRQAVWLGYGGCSFVPVDM